MLLKSEKIVEAVVTPHSVRLKLENGVHLDVCSNRGYIHLHFSGIGFEKPIEVIDRAANQLNITYPTVAD